MKKVREGGREGGKERGGRRSEEERGEGKERIPSRHVWCCLLLQVIMGETHMAGSEGRESCADKGCIHQW